MLVVVNGSCCLVDLLIALSKGTCRCSLLLSQMSVVKASWQACGRLK
jgi:hypothetical protein